MENITVKKSLELFEGGFNCAEATLKAINDTYNINSPAVPRIATGLGGGIAKTGNICGALSGTILGLSLISGRDSTTEKQDEVYTLIQNFLTQFETEFGATTCPSLTGCDLKTEEGQKNFSLPERREKCKNFVRRASEIATELLDKR